ncbi:MAG: hypothetical protein B6I20_06210 [Bacteroidetes bacterium 4572_117]|nr:MAG: hypothetical protein B6I20_06210 [Bacteroidetes bacterium 4572_117]
MRKMLVFNKIFCSVLLTACFSVQSANVLLAQDVQFSQLFADKLYLNPAYAGSDYCPRVMASYRNQWPGAQFPYVSYSASFDQYSEVLHGGYGIRLMKDDQGGGVFKMINADFIYAHKVKINHKSTLTMALQASVFQWGINASGLVFADMIDPVFGPVLSGSERVNSKAIFTHDLTTGFLLRHRKYFIGVNISHIPHNVIPEHNSILPMKITANIGAAFPIIKNGLKRPRYILEPNIIFIKQQTFNVLYYGMYFDVSKTAMGVFLRQDLKFHYDAMIFSFHVDVKQLKIAYSFDANLSGFIKHSFGSHEISLVYLFDCRKKIKDYGTISCPSF